MRTVLPIEANPGLEELLLVSVRPHQASYFQALARRRGSGTRWLDGARVSPHSHSRLPSELEGELEALVQGRHRELGVRGRSSLGARIGRGIERARCRRVTLGLASAYLEVLGTAEAPWIGVWNGGQWRTGILSAVARHLGRGTLFFENGLLPRTTTIDPLGVNAAGSIPTDPYFYRAWSRGAQDRTEHRLVARTSRKAQREVDTVLPESFVLVPFQIESDTQVLQHSPWIQGMETLVEVLVEARDRAGPEAPALVFREHPSCRQSRRGLRERAERAGAVFANANSMEELLNRASGVVTLNSTVGIEALLSGCPVLALGEAAYAIPGVAASARSTDEVARWLRTLDRSADAAPLAPAFLDFLARAYCVPGDWREPGAHHLDRASARIDSCLAGSLAFELPGEAVHR